MHERDMSGYRDASIYTPEELFNPELRQSRNDWLDFVESRPYKDESGQVHDPVTGEVINPDEYFAAKQMETVEPAEPVNYSDMPMSELAKQLARAEFAGNTDESRTISDALIDKLAAAELASHSERDKEHNGIRSDNLWARVMSIKDKELLRIGGQPSVDESKQEKLFEVAAVLEAPIEKAVAGPKALLEEKQAEARRAASGHELAAVPDGVKEDVPSDSVEGQPGQDVLPGVDEELLQADESPYAGLETSEGYEGPALKLSDSNGQTYHLEGGRVKVFNPEGELVSTYACEHGEAMPVARVGQGWKLANNFVTADITSIEPADPEAQPSAGDHIPEGGFDDGSLMAELANEQPKDKEKRPRGKHSKALGRSALRAVLDKVRKSKSRAKESIRSHKMVSGIAVAAVALAGIGIGLGSSETGGPDKAPNSPAATSAPNPSQGPEAKNQLSPTPSPSDIELKPGQGITISKDGKSASVDFK